MSSCVDNQPWSQAVWSLGPGSLTRCALRLVAQSVTNTLKGSERRASLSQQSLKMEDAEETMVCLACSGTPRLYCVLTTPSLGGSHRLHHVVGHRDFVLCSDYPVPKRISQITAAEEAPHTLFPN